MKQYYVYILTNKRNGTLYVGVTSDILKRIYEHKYKLTEGFTEKYDLKQLVFYEIHNDIEEAILREKRIKKWNRQWKINLIQKNNPQWNNLYESIL